MKKSGEEVPPPEGEGAKEESELEAIRDLLKENEEKYEETDEERSQEEFPQYQRKRHLFPSEKEKREEGEGREKRSFRPGFARKYQRKYHKREGDSS